MVNQLVDGLRNYSSGRQRHETGDEKTKSSYEERRCHEQEEKLGVGDIARVTPEIPSDEEDAESADDLRMSEAIIEF